MSCWHVSGCELANVYIEHFVVFIVKTCTVIVYSPLMFR